MKKKPHYKVTLVEEYPIYEPAEGGYYYAGQNCHYVKCKTRKEAQKVLKEIAQDYDLEIQSDNFAISYSRYIGENTICRIEKKNHTKTSGWRPYC